MIFGAKIVIFLETKEYFTHNLVIWRIFIWSFGGFSFGHLAHFHLVIWQVFIWSFGFVVFVFWANVPCFSAPPFPASCSFHELPPYSYAAVVG